MLGRGWVGDGLGCPFLNQRVQKMFFYVLQKCIAARCVFVVLSVMAVPHRPLSPPHPYKSKLQKICIYADNTMTHRKAKEPYWLDLPSGPWWLDLEKRLRKKSLRRTSLFHPITDECRGGWCDLCCALCGLDCGRFFEHPPHHGGDMAHRQSTDEFICYYCADVLPH